jgi:TRAP-type C4-dicarboxylate transport system permease small subunit
MIWGTLLVSAVLTFEKGHINLDYFFNRLPSTLARGLRVILGLAMASFLAAFLVSGLGLISTAIQVSQRSPGSGLPMAAVYVVLPLAAILMLIAQIFDIVDAARHH